MAFVDSAPADYTLEPTDHDPFSGSSPPPAESPADYKLEPILHNPFQPTDLLTGNYSALRHGPTAGGVEPSWTDNASFYEAMAQQDPQNAPYWRGKMNEEVGQGIGNIAMSFGEGGMKGGALKGVLPLHGEILPPEGGPTAALPKPPATIEGAPANVPSPVAEPGGLAGGGGPGESTRLREVRSIKTAIDRGNWNFAPISERVPRFGAEGDKTTTYAIEPNDVPPHWQTFQRPFTGTTVRYDPRLAKVDENGPQLNDSSSGSLPEKTEPGIIYRGMSHEEYQSALKNGAFQSEGGYNLSGQEGLTYFSDDPRQAEAYAHGFAPWQYKATPSRPAVVVGVRDPGGHVVHPDRPTELGIRGQVPTSAIDHVYVGYPAIISPGRIDVRTENGMLSEGSRSSPSVHVSWIRQNPPEDFFGKSVSMYNPPDAPPRPFSRDYPQGAPTHAATGRISTSIEGDPLQAGHIAGRTYPNEPDVGISPADYSKIIREATGKRPQSVDATRLGKDAAGVYRSASKQIQYLSDLNDEDATRVIAHEMGHMLDIGAGTKEGATQPGGLPRIATRNTEVNAQIEKELRNVYHDQNSVVPRSQAKKLVSPESRRYTAEETPYELMAEGFRSYMTNPNYFKSVAPTSAMAIRKFINTHPKLSKVIQFNAIGLPILVGGAAALGKKDEQ